MRRFVLSVAFIATVSGPVGADVLQPPADRVYSGETADYFFLVARRHERNGNIPEAIKALQRALELAPKSAEIRAELAGVYARQNRAAEALTAAEDALKYGPANQEANRVLGSIMAALAEQKKPLRPGDDPATYLPRAISALEKARGTSPTDLGLEYTLGRLYIRAGRNQDAVTALTRVFEQQPEYSEGGMLLAAAQEATGRVGDATTTLERVVRENPTYFRAHVRLIELYEQQRRWREAAAAYEVAQQVNPRAELTGGRAAALINSGATKEAQALLNAALAKKPDPSLMYLLAESQRRAGDYSASSATAQKLRAAFPDDARGQIIEAQLHVAQGRKQEAIKAFADLIKRVPNEASFVYQYAQLLEDAGQVAEAERALRDLLARDPMDANALNSLGYMFADRGERLDEAVELVQRALKIEPGNPSFLDSLGWAYFKKGTLDRAEGPLAEAAAKMPTNSVVQDHLGDLRFRQQRFADAVAAWEKALQGDGESIDKGAIEKKLRDARSRVQKK